MVKLILWNILIRNALRLEEYNMVQQRTDLQSFKKAQLEEIRNLRASMYCGGDNRLFWDELEGIIKNEDYPETHVWTRLENNEVVIGEVWSHPIGEIYYKNTVHKFAYLYVKTQGLAIREHGHEEIVHNGKQIRKIEEWYVFPDGKMELCRKDEKHKLNNSWRKPIYVLSIKVANGAYPIE